MNMIENNFTFQPSVNAFYDSLFNPSIFDRDVRMRVLETLCVQSKPCVCPSPLMLLEDLAQMGIPPEVYLAHLLNGLPHYSFYILANQCPSGDHDEQMIVPLQSEELEIECIDLRGNLEKVAKAVEKQAFVAFKKGTLGTSQAEMKIAPKWEKLLRLGEIQKIKIKKDELSESDNCHEINGCDVKFSTFTVQEVDEISTILFRVIDIASQIRTLEQQKKEADEKMKHAQQEIENRKKFKRQRAINSLKRVVEKRTQEQKTVRFNRKKSSLNEVQEAFIEHRRINNRQEEERQEELELQHDEKRLRIIRREIQESEI